MDHVTLSALILVRCRILFSSLRATLGQLSIRPGEGVIGERFLKLVARDICVAVDDFMRGAVDDLLIAARGARVADRDDRKPTAHIEDAVNVEASGRGGGWTLRGAQYCVPREKRPSPSKEYTHPGPRAKMRWVAPQTRVERELQALDGDV